MPNAARSRERELPLDIAGLELPDGFVWPDWDAPFDLDAHLRTIPADAMVKGMFLTSTVETVQAQGGPRLTEEKFTSFRDYPLRLTLELLAEGARRVHPDRTLRDGMRRLSRPSFAVFADTIVGRAVFATVRREPAPILRLASRAWRHATSSGKLETRDLDERSSVVRVADFHLSDAVAIGIAEGVLEACGRSGAVAQRMESASAGEFLILWE